METQPNTGTQGATRQSWSKGRARALLLDLITEQPHADVDALTDAIIEKLANDDELLRSIVAYWVANAFNYLKKQREPLNRAEVLATAEAIKRQHAIVVKATAKTLLLEMVLPTGQTVGDCTGAEIKALAPIVGGWLTAISKLVGATERVRDVLSEERLIAIYDDARAGEI